MESRNAHLFSKGTPFFLCLFDIEFPVFDIEIPGGLQIRCNHRGPFSKYGHNLGAETPVPAGTPQPDPRQDTAGSTCDPHRHQGNPESWKTPQRAKGLLTTQGQRKVPLPLGQTVLQVTGFPRDRDHTHASPRGRICMRVYESEMWELPGRTPARETTRKQSPVWSGDQQPWGECEDTEVPRRSPREKGDGHPCPGAR